MVWGAIPAEVTEHTTIDMLHKRVELSPDKIALVGQSCNRDEVRLTYADLSGRVDRLADGLRRLGVRSGDSVGILMDNRSGCEAMVGMLAIHRLRCVFVPLNARYAPAEVAYAIDKAECTAVIAASDQIAKLKTVRQDLPTLKHVVALDDADGLGPTYAEVIEAGDPDAAAWPKVTPDDRSDILFTSGTTAHPKGAVMTHGRTVTSAWIFKQTLGLTPDDVVQSFFPCFVTAGPRCLVLPSWWAGGTAVMDPAMAVEDVLARLRRERSTIYYAVPSFFIFLLEAFDRGRHDLSSVRQFVYGGAAMSREVIGKLAQAFPHIRLMQTYGSTEMGPSGTVLDPEHALTKLGSIGRPMPSVEVALVDETGKPVPTGDVGEIAAFCRERLADFKVPRRITFVDALPRNPMGKVLKTTLRQMAVETSGG